MPIPRVGSRRGHRGAAVGLTDLVRRRVVVIAGAAALVAVGVGAAVLFSNRRDEAPAVPEGTVAAQQEADGLHLGYPSPDRTGRPAQAWAADERSVVTFGGTFSNGDEIPMNLVPGDGAVLDIAARRWTRIPPPPVEPRLGPSLAVIDGTSVYVLGQRCRETRDEQGDAPDPPSCRPGDLAFARYDLPRREWRVLAAPTAPDPLPAIASGQLELVDGSIVLTGLTTQRYDARRTRWTVVAPPIDTDLTCVAARRVIAISDANHSEDWGEPERVWVLQSDGAWREVAPSGLTRTDLVDARCHRESGFVVRAGRNGGYVRLDPAAGTWTEVAQPGWFTESRALAPDVVELFPYRGGLGAVTRDVDGAEIVLPS